MPMIQVLTKNKRFVARKAPRKTVPTQNKNEVSPFPEYIEQKDGLYRCLLCKSRTLERHMWLNRCGMYQHEKRGTRHKRSVKEWLEAKYVDSQPDTSEPEGNEASSVDDVSDDVEEQPELEDDVEMEEPGPEPEPIVEEPGTPALYYPTTSWDEPVNQGVRVPFDESQVIEHETELQDSPELQEPPAIPEVRKEVTKWDGSYQGCVYASTKTNGYYTCIWCNLPDMPQRKYRRCKRITKALQKRPIQVMEKNTEINDLDPPPYQLLYPSY